MAKTCNLLDNIYQILKIRRKYDKKEERKTINTETYKLIKYQYICFIENQPNKAY